MARWTRIRAALTPAEWRRAALLAAVIVGLHAAGFFILLALVVPNDYSLAGGGVFGLGVGITAYTLGLRHAFDADHIAAIDNTTRKLMGEGQRPLSVGLLLLARALDDRVRARRARRGRRARAERRARERQLGACTRRPASIGPAISGTSCS